MTDLFCSKCRREFSDRAKFVTIDQSIESYDGQEITPYQIDAVARFHFDCLPNQVEAKQIKADPDGRTDIPTDLHCGKCDQPFHVGEKYVTVNVIVERCEGRLLTPVYSEAVEQYHIGCQPEGAGIEIPRELISRLRA